MLVALDLAWSVLVEIPGGSHYTETLIMFPRHSYCLLPLQDVVYTYRLASLALEVFTAALALASGTIYGPHYFLGMSSYGVVGEH